MTKLNVPGEFVEVLKKIEIDVKPENVVDALEWAIENPERARDVAEGFQKLNYLGRKEFETCIWLGYSPDNALESARKRQTENSEKRSLLGKALTGARRGGYKFKMPNGVECIVKYDGNHYKFTFNPGGVEVTLIRGSGRHFSSILAELQKGYISRYGIDAVIYREKAYYSGSSQAEAILKAIEENVSPEILAAANL